MATISTLEPYVSNRLEETPGATIFWDITGEIYSAIVEAMCEMMLLVGRPDLIVSQPMTINANTPWQTVPPGMFCITNIQGPATEVWKASLQDLDYAQVAGPDWEQDVGDTITTWAPIGLNQFVVHPSVSEDQVVLVTGIASPVVDQWPYTGTETVPFADQFFQAIEKYATHYCRFKEGQNAFASSMSLYEGFLADAKRMTALEDRRDPFIFSAAIGSPVVSNPTKIR